MEPDMTDSTRFEPSNARIIAEGDIKQRGQAEACPVDIYEEDDAFTLEAEVPGVDEDDVDIEVDRKQTVRLRVRRDGDRPKTKMLRAERQLTCVERDFLLPTQVDESGIEKTLDRGVLRVRVPKA
jgi:HSP20 family molecular chaperone IbpA